jgi:transcriptional regulator with XRE-family HTH domain
MYRTLNPWSSFYGRRIETLRLSLGITNLQLASMLGVNPMGYRRVKKGGRPRLPLVQRLIQLETQYKGEIDGYKRLHPDEMGTTLPMDPIPSPPPRAPAGGVEARTPPDSRVPSPPRLDDEGDSADKVGRSIFAFR